MEHPDTHQALIKGFDGIPADLMITFCEALPDGTYCNLCNNVFPRLHRDPEGHNFCESCTKMATTNNVFECPEDGSVFSSQLLTRNLPAPSILWTQTLHCPNSSKDEPIKIRFAALQAHVKDCKCAIAAKAQGKEVSSPRHQSATSTTIRSDQICEAPKQHGVGIPESPAQQTHEEKAAADIVERKVLCSYCDKWFSKREIRSHMKPKTCRRSQEPPLSSTPAETQNGGETNSARITDMEWSNLDEQLEALNDPQQTHVKSIVEHGGRQGDAKDQEHSIQEEISLLKEQIRCLSEQLQQVTGIVKQILPMLGFPPEN